MAERPMLIRHQGMGGWHAPSTTAYTNEDELQQLVAETPTLLPGIGDGPTAVAREVPLGSAGYVDILIVDATGEITLVECKLRANPEIRRQVVGQALAYAAALWQSTYAELDEAFASRAGTALASRFGEGEIDWDEEGFRETVARNLAEGSLGLVIAVDEITDELKRTVTFLNRHTTSALRLLAVELRRAADDGVEVLILESYGEESAGEVRPPRRPREWDEESWFAALANRGGEHEMRAARDLYDWTVARGWQYTFGAGQDGILAPVCVVDDRWYSPIALYTSGRVRVLFRMGGQPPFNDEHTRLELLHRVNEIPGVAFDPEVMAAQPAVEFRLRLLADDAAALEQLKRVFEWIEAEARKTA